MRKGRQEETILFSVFGHTKRLLQRRQRRIDKKHPDELWGGCVVVEMAKGGRVAEKKSSKTTRRTFTILIDER